MEVKMRHTSAMVFSVGLVLWVIAFAALIVIVVLGAMLAYHWIRYAMNHLISSVAIGIFSAVSGLLLLTIFGAVTAYTL